MIFSKQDAGYSSRLGPRSNFLFIVSVGGERWVSVGGVPGHAAAAWTFAGMLG